MSSNYSEELSAIMVAHGDWTYAEAVAFAAEQGLPHRSVIAKIKSLGLNYATKPVRVTKNNEPVTRKSQFVSAIESALRVSTPSLEKVTKQDLETLTRAIIQAGVEAEMPKPQG